MQSKYQAAAAVIVIWQLCRNAHTRHNRMLVGRVGITITDHFTGGGMVDERTYKLLTSYQSSSSVELQ